MTHSPDDPNQNDPIRVELRLRENTPPSVAGPLENFCDRVTHLEATGVVDDCQIDHWACRTQPAEFLAECESTVSSTIADFRTWARRNGYTLRPAFTQRERSSLVCDRSQTELVVPMACVAVYEADELACVAPCSPVDEERTYTVGDCLDELEAGVIGPTDGDLEREYDASPEESGTRERADGDPALGTLRETGGNGERRTHARSDPAHHRSFTPEMQ